MYLKFLNLLFLLIVIPAFASDVPKLPQAWLGTHYGVCYRSIANAMSEAYGPNYDLDDNIGHSYVRFGANEMIVSVDRTSGTNASRLIFERRRNGNWCVILASPPTASLVPSMQKTASSRPLQWTSLTQAAAGYSETKVVYMWDEHKSIYFPINCFHINKKSVKKIDCENAYSE